MVVAISAALLTVEISRFCGVTNRGIYFLAVLAATLLALVGDLGLSMAAITYGAAERTRAAALHGLAIVVSLATAALGAAILLAFSGFWTRTVLKGLDRTMLVLLALGTAPLLYSQITGALLTALGRIGEISKIRAGGSVAAAVITLPAVWISGGSALWALVAWLIATAVLAAATAVAVLREAPVPVLPSPHEAREIVSFGLRGQVGSVSHYGFLRIDVLFVSARLGPAAVGLYSLASVIAEKISILGHAIYAASASRVGSLPREESAELTAALVRTILIALVPASVVVAVFARPLITAIFGSSFADAATPLVLLLPGTVGLTLWYIVSLFLISALRRPGLTTIIQAAALLLSIAPYYLAVEHWGINGAAVVSSGVYVFVLVAGTIATMKLSGLSLARLIPRPADARHLVNVTVRQPYAALTGRRSRA